MQSKTLLLALIAIIFFGTAYAQDKIYKRNGDVVEAKIKTIGTKTITYLRFDNQAGPEYTILKLEVEKIKYQNGSEDEFSIRRPRLPYERDTREEKEHAPDKTISYRPNVITVSPMQFSENGLGFGLSYERAIDDKGVIAFYLPVAATFNLNNSYRNPNTGYTVNGNNDVMLYAMPGVKVYPTGSFGKVRYAVGPSLVIGDGQKSASFYSGAPGYTYEYRTQSHFVLGILVNNSLNINPSPHIYLGLEVGLGFSYMNQIAGLNQGTIFLAQGGFRIGYRF